MDKQTNIRWTLMIYDLLVFLLMDVLLFVIYDRLSIANLMIYTLILFVVIFGCRLIGNIYGQIWRYGGIQCYIRLLSIDMISFVIYFIIFNVLSIYKVTSIRLLAFGCMNLLAVLSLRMIYRYAYKCADNDSRKGRFLKVLLKIFSGLNTDERDNNRIKVAIIGAGRIGAGLAEELMNNSSASYEQRCFKIGRASCRERV